MDVSLSLSDLGLPVKTDITVAIPTIPPRAEKLARAVKSVFDQTFAASALSIAIDTKKRGAAHTRQRALDGVKTTWVAFLDDDDYFYSNHLEKCMSMLEAHEADVAYTWFDGNNPFPMHRGREWNPKEPHHITMTLVVRTELAQDIGFALDHPEGWTLPQEDWRMIVGLNNLGARFIGTGDITWHYTVDGGNTSGLPTW